MNRKHILKALGLILPLAGTQYDADAGRTMQDIVGAVERVNGIIGDMTSAASRQSDGIQQINAAVSALDTMTQQNAALVEKSAPPRRA